MRFGAAECRKVLIIVISTQNIHLYLNCQVKCDIISIINEHPVTIEQIEKKKLPISFGSGTYHLKFFRKTCSCAKKWPKALYSSAFGHLLTRFLTSYFFDCFDARSFEIIRGVHIGVQRDADIGVPQHLA